MGDMMVSLVNVLHVLTTAMIAVHAGLRGFSPIKLLDNTLPHGMLISTLDAFATLVTEAQAVSYKSPSGADPVDGYGNEAGRDCSGRGICNYNDGTCSCFSGYYGTRCQFVTTVF